MLKNFSSAQLKRIQEFWQQLLESKEPEFVLLRLILAGILIRFCVMPFFCHPDFLSEFRRIHLQFQEWNIFPGARFIVTLVEMVNYTIAYPLIGNADSQFYMPENGVATAGHQDFFIFVSHPERYSERCSS